MSKRGSLRVILRGMAVAGLLAFSSNVGWASTETPPEGTSRLATYDSSTGETNFALSLSPQFKSTSTLPSDVVIFVDTSASQTGLYKKDSIELVEKILQTLSVDDRVKVVAVDLDTIPLNANFASPGSDELIAAVAKLNERVPLGSTDLVGMLQNSTGLFDSAVAGRNRSVIYVGDGLSRGGLMHDRKFNAVVAQLGDSRISVSGYAIGPERDIESLAALANQLGGNLLVDSDDANCVSNAAKHLVDTVHGPIFWPVDATFPDSITEILPQQLPPLRADRDTIVLGNLSERKPLTIHVSGEVNGQAETMTWTVVAENSSDDFAFLPKLIDSARNNGGMTLPTIGSAGLMEAARVLSAGSRTLSQLGSSALLSGNLVAAKKMAVEALSHDPANTEAELLLTATNNPEALRSESVPATPVEESVPTQEETAPPVRGQEQQPVGSSQGALQLIGPGAQDNEIKKLIQEEAAPAGDLMQQETDRQRVIEERLQAQIRYEMGRAQEELREDPNQAIERLKSVIDILDQTADVSADIRADLRSRLESALMTSRQRKLDFDAALAAKQKNDAIALEHMRTLEDLERREEKISRLINRFNSLLVEENYKAAEDVTLEALNMDLNLPEANAAYESARLVYNAALERELRRQREVSFLQAMYYSEKSAATFVAEPPLLFPDAESWARKKALRAKYQDVRLAGNANDERILRTLETPVGNTFTFDETPFSDVINQLKNEYGINVILDQSASDGDLPAETPITFSAVNIRLKNALKLMLKEKNATYIVRDEVLLIISSDVASDPEYFVTNIYNVGDLVAPRRSVGGFGGGNFGGGGGGGGLGGGGGGGNFGGGGGGFGGGGGGGPAGGGIFCIQDSVGSQPVSTQPAVASEPTPIQLPPGSSWNDYFGANFADPAAIRASVRDLMNGSQPNEVIELVQAAIAHNQVQPWMYEAMVLAMQIADRPVSEIERALMSAVDLSDNAADAMIVVDYMAKNGMEKRAVRLLMDIAEQNPGSPEPFVIGLRAAQKISDEDGIRWATAGILSEAWPKNRHVVREAIVAAKALQARMEKENRTEELTSYRHELDQVLQRDCIIEVAWTGDADLDLFVEEPGGSVCSRLNPKSSGGGYLMGDEFSMGSSGNGQMVEYYVLPKGFSGDYRLLVRHVWGRVANGKATVTIRQNFGTDQEKSETRQVAIDDKGALVLFQLANGRRVEEVDASALNRMVDEQFVVNRTVLAQQLDALRSPQAAASYARSRYGMGGAGSGNLIGNLLRNQAGLLGRPGVGYQPVVSQFFQGSTMTVNHATTADRLFVLVSVSPFFSQISEVTTFNFFGNAGNAQGGGGGGLGGGGGGLGGGGGGLGGGGGGGGGLF